MTSLSRLAAATLTLALISACGGLGDADALVDEGHEGDDAHDLHDDGSNLLQQGIVDCSARGDVGYSNGRAFPITVVSADGRPAERDTANAYAVMQSAAARAGVYLRVVSGFRTQSEQQYLYNCYRTGRCNGGNVAAPPGYSNHQSGHALDLNTSSAGVLRWLTNNAGRFGFKRTVPSEAWHWEWWGGGPGGGPCGGAVTGPQQNVPSNRRVAMAAKKGEGSGYWVVARDGAVYSFGAAHYFGGANGKPLNAPIVAVASTPDGNGYWLVAADGGIFAFGNAGFFGSAGGIKLNAPIVGMAATPSGRGYWLAAADGGIFAFGDAGFHGSTGGISLNQPIVGIASTPSGGGYWLVAADGGIFAFGDAGFHGSLGATPLNAPIVGISAAPNGKGYWLVSADGGIFSFGDAPFYGSLGGTKLNQPVVGLAATKSGQGYWLVAADGGLFAFGNDATFHGSAVDK